MIFDALADFRAALPAFGRLGGLDVGTKTVGFATCDAGRTVATPQETLKRGKFTADATRLVAWVETEALCGLVIGWPLQMDGAPGKQAQSVRQFARNLEKHVALPMLLWDERLSTAAVTRPMLEADLSRAKRAQAVDKLAAAYILQGALEAMRYSGT